MTVRPRACVQPGPKRWLTEQKVQQPRSGPAPPASRTDLRPYGELWAELLREPEQPELLARARVRWRFLRRRCPLDLPVRLRRRADLQKQVAERRAASAREVLVELSCWPQAVSRVISQELPPRCGQQRRFRSAEPNPNSLPPGPLQRLSPVLVPEEVPDAQPPEQPSQLWPLVSLAEGVWLVRASRVVPAVQWQLGEPQQPAQPQVPQTLAPAFRARPSAKVREQRAKSPSIVRR